MDKALEQDIAQNPTIFGKLLRRELPVDVVYEDDTIFAFKTIEPKAKIHFLIIPKKHITEVDALKAEDAAILAHLFTKIPHIAKLAGLTNGYRIISNSGADSRQEVPHLHFHIVGGEQLSRW
jgi:histidine triad (HIT) family protein